MRSPTQSTVWRAIACDKASKSNIFSRQFPVWAEAARPARLAAAGTVETFKPPVTRNIFVLCPDCAAPALPHSGRAGNFALLVPCEGRVKSGKPSFDFTCRQRAATDWASCLTIKRMNINSTYRTVNEGRNETSPILIVPYMWIGDFVRGHTVVRVLKERWPNRPVDLLTTSLCAPLVDYMPGVR